MGDIMKIIAKHEHHKRVYTYTPCISLSLSDDHDFDFWIEVCKDDGKIDMIRQIEGYTLLLACSALIERHFELEIIE